MKTIQQDNLDRSFASPTNTKSTNPFKRFTQFAIKVNNLTAGAVTEIQKFCRYGHLQYRTLGGRTLDGYPYDLTIEYGYELLMRGTPRTPDFPLCVRLIQADFDVAFRRLLKPAWVRAGNAFERLNAACTADSGCCNKSKIFDFDFRDFSFNFLFFFFRNSK